MVVKFVSCVTKTLDQLKLPGTMVSARPLTLTGGKCKTVVILLLMSATDSNWQSASTSVLEKMFLI